MILIKKVRCLDKFVQQDMKNKMKNVVDTHGAQRIAKVLVGIK